MVKSYDKTFSELWNLTENKDILIAETGHMAIKALKELQEENRRLNSEIGRYTSQLFEISKGNMELADRTKSLINKMLTP